MTYATPEDVRKEGIDNLISEERISNALELATEKINILTGRSFETLIPALIRRACVLIAIRFYIPTAEATKELEFERRIISETTDGHSYTLDHTPRIGGTFTGDGEIDEIISFYRRPMRAFIVGGEVKLPL